MVVKELHGTQNHPIENRRFPIVEFAIQCGDHQVILQVHFQRHHCPSWFFQIQWVNTNVDKQRNAKQQEQNPERCFSFMGSVANIRKIESSETESYAVDQRC